MDTIGNNILKDRDFLMGSLVKLVRDEGNRVLHNKLASREDLRCVIESTIEKMDGEDEADVLVNILSSLHSKLASVKLPGDFKKIAVKKEVAPATNNVAIVEDKVEVVQDPIEAQRAVARQVSKELEKIAYSLGNAGNHEAAYLVERAINTIKQAANKGKLFTK